MMSDLISEIKKRYPKLYIVSVVNNDIKFKPEKERGFIEYKRTLSHCSEEKTSRYASQMKWRISENHKTNYASYFIGLDDDGTIRGLTDTELMDCIDKIVTISKLIQASIMIIRLIHANDRKIIHTRVKIKKIKDKIDSWLIDF